MTKRQIKICRCVKKFKKLNVVLRKCNIPDYLEIQNILGADVLDFSDNDMDDGTEIFLQDAAIEEIEKHREYVIDNWITRIVAVWGGITGTIALIVQLVQLFQ